MSREARRRIYPPDDGKSMTSRQVCKVFGITYRQLDHWCRTGFVSDQRDEKSSGNRRVWTEHMLREVAQRALMQRVLDAISTIQIDGGRSIRSLAFDMNLIMLAEEVHIKTQLNHALAQLAAT